MSDAYADAELAALYDLVYADYDADLSLYEGFARRGELPSLELCVGSGRVALHLARQGMHVVGVDSSLPMLARLEARLDRDAARRLRAVEADVRDFDLGEKFDLVYCALDSLEMFIVDAEVVAVLRCACAHLAKGGVFVAELRTLRAVDWSASARQPALLEWTKHDPETGDIITKISSLRASIATQTTTTQLIFDRSPRDGGTVRRRAFDVTLRVYGVREIAALIERAGMRVTQMYGGCDLSPLSDDSDTMVVVAERAT
jgi:SAM-dependent methyltransferase